MASNFQAVHSALRSWFKTNVTDAESLQTQFDNMEFTPPETGEWCRFTTIPGESTQAEINGGGGGTVRTPGICVASLFTEFEKGDKPLLDLADIIADAVSPGVVSGVTLRPATLQRIGRAGKWWQVNVTIPYFADRT